jgi:predicted transcriptional regulator
MKELTKAEEEVMQVLWDLKRAFVNDILAEIPEPRPAYNTVSTIVRILERKKFVAHESHGRSHKYYPLISRENYRQQFFNRFLHNYFGDSPRSFASFFSKDDKVSLQDLEEIRDMMQKEIERKKGTK